MLEKLSKTNFFSSILGKYPHPLPPNTYPLFVCAFVAFALEKNGLSEVYSLDGILKN